MAKLNKLLAQGKGAVLCTLIYKDGSGPRDPGTKMLITNEGKTVGTIGGGGMERLLVKEALGAMEEGRPRTIHFALGTPPREGMISVDSKCGGEVKVFIDVINPEPRLIIMGSGLIAQVVARYAHDCGFQVIVIDDAETAKEKNFPGATLVNDPYPASLRKVEVRHSDYVAILHGETPFELAALRHAIEARPAYIGLLGSTNKAKKHKEQLKSEGFDAKVLDAIHGPIGIEINAETPEEIAISIVAEIIKEKRG